MPVNPGEKSWVDADHPRVCDRARHLCASCESCQGRLASALARLFLAICAARRVGPRPGSAPK